MVIVAVKMSLALVALMIFELCAVGDADMVRTNVPSRLPSLPLFPCSNCKYIFRIRYELYMAIAGF